MSLEPCPWCDSVTVNAMECELCQAHEEVRSGTGTLRTVEQAVQAKFGISIAEAFGAEPADVYRAYVNTPAVERVEVMSDEEDEVVMDESSEIVQD